MLQKLATLRDVRETDYLSTVSGGGSVGSWLTSWIRRHPGGTPGVLDDLANGQPLSPVTPEPRPVHHLREYSNYLSPQLGMLSADTWTLVGIYLRNLILNWTVLIPLLLAVLAIPRLVLSFTLLRPGPRVQIATLIAGSLLLVVAVVSSPSSGRAWRSTGPTCRRGCGGGTRRRGSWGCASHRSSCPRRR